MELLYSFPRLHFASEPEVASPNVGCFLRHFANIQIGNIAQLQLVLKIWQLPHDILNTERKQRVHTKNCNHFLRAFQGPPTRNIISQIVTYCIKKSTLC